MLNKYLSRINYRLGSFEMTGTKPGRGSLVFIKLFVLQRISGSKADRVHGSKILLLKSINSRGETMSVSLLEYS